jgi:hypothetical protein
MRDRRQAHCAVHTSCQRGGQTRRTCRPMLISKQTSLHGRFCLRFPRAHSPMLAPQVHPTDRTTRLTCLNLSVKLGILMSDVDQQQGSCPYCMQTSFSWGVSWVHAPESHSASHFHWPRQWRVTSNRGETGPETCVVLDWRTKGITILPR